MGGGGFMQHASDTNRKDRAQRAARREKFNGNHSDKTILNENHSTKLDFSHLTSDQIALERKRIAEKFRKRKRNQLIAVISAVSIVIVAFIYVYRKIWI